MNSKILQLGQKALDKERRQQTRIEEFTKVARHFKSLVEQALLPEEECSIIAWGPNEGAFFPLEKIQTTAESLIEEKTGICRYEKGRLNPNWPKHIIHASFKVTHNNSGNSIEVWPMVGAWQATIINQICQDIVISENTLLSFHFVGCRSVRGFLKEGGAFIRR